VFDIGFWELLVIAVVLLLVMGPERLPEVARQAAFFVRKARQGMFRLRSEMRSELDTSSLGDLAEARREMTDLKNDFKQFGRDLANSHEEGLSDDDDSKEADGEGSAGSKKVTKKTTRKKPAGKRESKKTAKKNTKTTARKTKKTKKKAVKKST